MTSTPQARGAGEPVVVDLSMSGSGRRDLNMSGISGGADPRRLTSSAVRQFETCLEDLGESKSQAPKLTLKDICT